VLSVLDPIPGNTDASAVWSTPQVPLPPGLTLAEVEKAMRSWSVNGEPPGHLDGYVADSKLRFLYTWNQVADLKGRCLELGANPYFTTWLLDEYTDLDLTLANYYGTRGETSETVSWLPPGSSTRREVVRKSSMFNVEEDEFPYPDESFDVLLFCEMIEHMLMDPMATLRQIHRVLKPGGVMLLTTPNVARIENVVRLTHGLNMYDPYSGFGPYGRHNREFTRHELHRLMEFAGFEVEQSITADGHPVNLASYPLKDAVAPLLSYRAADLGHYVFVRARKAGPPRDGLPSFLYRSRPAGEIVDFE
jgi:SAM-dependent methyltransferase